MLFSISFIQCLQSTHNNIHRVTQKWSSSWNKYYFTAQLPYSVIRGNNSIYAEFSKRQNQAAMDGNRCGFGVKPIMTRRYQKSKLFNADAQRRRCFHNYFQQSIATWVCAPLLLAFSRRHLGFDKLAICTINSDGQSGRGEHGDGSSIRGTYCDFLGLRARFVHLIGTIKAAEL